MLGHEGAGVVEAVGEGVTRVRVGDHVALSWTPSCGTCEECLRDLPWHCSTAWPAMGNGRSDGRDAAPLARRGEPVYHYSFLSTFAEACVVPERSCVPIAGDVPFEIAGARRLRGLDRRRRRLAHRRRATGRSRRIVGCGGVGLSALLAAVAVGADPMVAVDAAARSSTSRASSARPTRSSWQGSAEETAEAVREASGGGVDYAIEATGRPEAMLAAFLSTRPRGAAVLIGIPARGRGPVALPALTIPRMERRVLGSIYGSTWPERDFAQTLDLYRAGRLPLDRARLAPAAARARSSARSS